MRSNSFIGWHKEFVRVHRAANVETHIVREAMGAVALGSPEKSFSFPVRY